MPSQGHLFEQFARNVVDVPVDRELSESFLSYSLSVITSRAIPDVRDGLKPVQRRILFSMSDMGLRPDRPHRKCAGVVGDTMGKYHPHGDGAIYDALVRMGQDFSRNVTLIDPRGNFGFLDDPPAAYRYTECRLTDAAMSMLGELDEETGSFRPTFDGQRDEPTVLPALLPNLLVNGTSGIAVGMATNMACHNLREVYEAIKLVMSSNRKTADIDALMKVLPGPDFPSGAILVDDGLAEAMATGRGSFRMRARASIVPITRTRQGIEITELPFQVGPERVVSRVQDLVRDGKISGIAAINDYSDRKSGLRLVIECKTGVNPKALLTDLYRQTPLEESFGVNNVVLVDGVPTTMGIWDLCQHYVAHRLEIIVNRTNFRLERALAALHLREGRLIALDAIDLVVSIIRTSNDTPHARSRLMEELSLSEIQAADILEMPLRRLTALARLELETEISNLRDEIAGYQALLESPSKQRKLLLAELKELVDAHGRDRRTQIVLPDQLTDVTGPSAGDAAEDAADEPCIVALTASGLVGREPLAGVKPSTFGRHDVIRSRVATTTFGVVWALTSRGRCVPGIVGDISEVTGRTRGSAVGDVFGLEKGEEIHLLVAAPAGGSGPSAHGDSSAAGTAGDAAPVLLVTADGVAKRIDRAEITSIKAAVSIINLKPGDSVVAAFDAPDGAEAIVVASNAQALRLPVASVSVQGKGAAGVAGMKLSTGSKVVGAGLVEGDSIVLTVTDAQTAKVTDAAELPAKGRGTGGVRGTKFKDEKRIDWAYVGPEAHLVLIVGQPDNPPKPDNSPEPLSIPHTARDLISRPTSRRLLDIGQSRW